MAVEIASVDAWVVDKGVMMLWSGVLEVAYFRCQVCWRWRISLPEYIPSLEKRAGFKKEVKRYLGDN